MGDENNPLGSALNGEFERDWLMAVMEVTHMAMEVAFENAELNEDKLATLASKALSLQEQWSKMLGPGAVNAANAQLTKGWHRFNREAKRYLEARESWKKLNAAKRRFSRHAMLFSLWSTARFCKNIQRGIEDGSLAKKLKEIGLEDKVPKPQFKRGGEKPQ